MKQYYVTDNFMPLSKAMSFPLLLL